MVSSLGVGLAAVAACCLAGQALTIRLATRHGKPADVLLVVIAVNVVVLVPLTALVVPDPVVTWRSLGAFVLAGLTGTLVGRSLFYAGIKRIGASRAEPIKASMPLHATILAFLFLDEVVTGGQFVGVVLVVAGIAFVSRQGRDANTDVDGASGLGASLPLAAAFFFALEPIFATVGLREGTSAFVGLTVKTLAAFVVIVAYLAWRDSIPRPGDVPRRELGWYVLAGTMSTGFLLAYYAGLAVSRVGIVVPIMQTSPLLVILASAVLLKGVERVTPRLVVGALTVVAGAVVVTLTG
ncbi:DMT family transporter [Halorarum salinum]|uniref:DMT family transporter n=1 Tax=Halorarum salinum TaxID=2743089 RepID=A0A7D5QJY5_9EURY|nr:EamA family transporter [Halobaculum salinum]QLG61725.1 DMT family transporter [Halobaculum salinum]